VIGHKVPFFYHAKFPSYRNILTRTGTQDRFTSCGLCFCNLLTETNNFSLRADLLSCLVSKLQKPSSLGLEPRTVFGVVAIIPIISSSKQTTLVLAPFCYRFRATGTTLNRTQTEDNFSSFDLSKLSSWSQGINMPCLVQISISILELYTNVHAQFQFYI
jgi:hypothetical protein